MMCLDVDKNPEKPGSVIRVSSVFQRHLLRTKMEGHCVGVSCGVAEPRSVSQEHGPIVAVNEAPQ